MRLTNTEFHTEPLVVHANGNLDHVPHWPPIREAFFNSEPQNLGVPEDLTVITCNDGHPALGLFESSLRRLGVPHISAGSKQGPVWRNSIDKIRTLREILAETSTKYVLYADSRDAILIGDPRLLLERFVTRFEVLGATLLFSADTINWPPDKSFRRYEDSLSALSGSTFRYLNSGVWVGRVDAAASLFELAARTDPHPEAPDSDQGILRRLLPQFHKSLLLDYRCELFQNVGFVYHPILQVEHDSVYA
jgi:hypothetical protein